MAVELKRIMGQGRVRFVWVGVNEDVEGWQFKAMARKLKIEADVEFVPVTPEPLRHFADFDVFAMSSWEDPFPIVMIENMMLGKPVVCFAGSGGAPEGVGDAGIVVPEFSPGEMAKAIAGLAESPERMALLGKMGFQRVRDRLTSAVQVPKIREEIYRLANANGSG